METTYSGVHNRSQPSSATVGGWATNCLQSFQSCLNRAALVHPREHSLVENQAARFSLWVANSMVFAKGRASMDYRLREAPDVQDVVIGLLEALGHRVQRCTGLLAAQADHTDPFTSVRDAFAQALEGISNSLQLLFRFSNTVRKASKAVHNQKVDDGFRIRDDEGNDIESHLRQMFANYMLDRYPGASDILHERLVSTMLLRRKRILYRKSRYGTVTQPSQQPPSELRRPDVAPAASDPREMNAMRAPVTIDLEPNDLNVTPESVVRTATTLSPENFHKASSAPSVMSVAKTVPLTQHEEIVFPPAPFGQPLHQYNIWKREIEDRRRQLTVAYAGFGPPTEIYSNWLPYATRRHEDYMNSACERFHQGAESFPCPFCFCTLPLEDTTQEEKWRSHVLSDLDPYVCLFENCNMEHELYSHSHSWLDHMRGHALRWRCSSKSHQDDFIAATKDEYLNHMDLSHKGKFTTSQLTVLAQRNARMMGPLFESCPLCGMVPDLDTGPMEDHVVGHLRKIAIHSLPKFHLDSNEVDEHADSQRQPEPSDDSQPDSRTDIEDHDNDNNEGDEEYDDWVADYLSNNKMTTFVEEEIPLIAQDSTGSQLRSLQWGFVPGTFNSQVDSVDSDSPTQSIVGRVIGCGSDVQSTPAPKPDNQSTDAPDIPRKTTRVEPNCAFCDAPAEKCCDCEAIGLYVTTATAERNVLSKVQNRVREWVRGHAEDIMKKQFKRPILREFALQTLAKSHQDAEKALITTLPPWTGFSYASSSYVHLAPDIICNRASIDRGPRGATDEESRHSPLSESPGRGPDGGVQENHSVAEVYHEVLDYLFSLPKLACPDNNHPIMNLPYPPIPPVEVEDVEETGTSTPRSGVADGIHDQADEQPGVGDTMKNTPTPQGEYYRPEWLDIVPTYSYHGARGMEQDSKEKNSDLGFGSQSGGSEERQALPTTDKGKTVSTQ